MTRNPAMIASRASLAALRGGTAMAAALALAAGAAPALADGFNGTVSSSTGVVFNSGTDITVTGAEAVINWNATAGSAADTNVDFLPAGQTVTFHDPVSGNGGDFTVLNRVFPGFGGAAIPATISLSGTVNSTIGGNQGGNVWFYSPYGIIANATSAFNVGSLLLTTSDIDTSASGSLYLDQTNGNKIGFLQAAQGGSFVRVLPGAQINASNVSVNNAYVGLFAPRIEQGGSIRSDGMTALVAAEAGTITFNAGLVDIAVSVGTSDANGIVHTGSTGGAASLDGESKTVAFVAVPKNTALTMLLSGTFGNDAAAAGITDNSAVELYAGSTTQTDAVRPDPGHLLVSAPGADTTGNIAIGNATFISRTQALATGDIAVNPVYAGVNSPGLVDFRQNASLIAGKSIRLTADAGDTIQAGDSLSLAPMLRRAGEDVTISVSGDPANVIAPGQITVTNFLDISADGRPDPFAQTINAVGAAGQGGDIAISVSQGTLSSGFGMTITANGAGEDGVDAAGSGTGGTIDIGVSNKGTISASGLYLAAVGSGGNSFAATAPVNSAGGDGFGGSIDLHDDGGNLRFTDVTAYAEGHGGTGSVSSGSATGGLLAVRINGSTQNWNSLTASASATAGDLQSTTSIAGSATGRANGLLLAVGGTGALNVGTADLFNDAVVTVGGAQVYAGTAGSLDVQVSGGGSLTVTGLLRASAEATIPIETFIGQVDAAPAMTGGQVSVIANGGTIDVGAVDLAASALGIAGGTAGALAQGGSAQLGALGGGTITLGTAQTNSVRAEAYGAVGPGAANARGGNAQVFADNGTITTSGDLAVSASALSGGIDYQFSLAGTGFAATGGTAAVNVLGAGGSISVGNLAVYAKGEATVAFIPSGASDLAGYTTSDILGISGNGGTGTGGTARIGVQGGSLAASQILVRAYGLGGASDMNSSGPAFQSGAGLGGLAQVNQSGGTITTDLLDVAAGGTGGMLVAAAEGGSAANGGNAGGGTAQVVLSGGTMTLTGPLTIGAAALGGTGMATTDASAGGNGGAANNAAAVAELVMPAGSTASLSAPGLLVSAAASGGAGGTTSGGTDGTGGAAQAGTARVNLADGAISVPGAVIIGADALGGTGSTGGNATGGTAAFLLTDSLAAPATTRSLGSLALSGSATGGTGASAAAAGTSSAGTTRLTARAGRSASALSIAGDFTAQAAGQIAPAGDGFTGNFGAIPVSVGGNVAISTPRDINGTMLAGGGLAAAGTLDLVGRSIAITGPGVLAADGNVTVLADSAINLGGLSSGGTTTLTAQNPVSSAWGPVSVASLSSVGLVTVSAGAFDAASPGALTFADSFAANGDFKVQTAGNLTVGVVTAPGQISLTSTGGTLRNTGSLSGGSVALGAGGAILADAAITSQSTLVATAGGALTSGSSISALGNTSIDAAGGITVPTLTSGGTTLLRATGGAISIGTLLSSGAVTLLGRTATVSSTGPLTVAGATTTAGDLVLSAGGDMVIAAADASGAVTLSAPGGNITASAFNATGAVTANARAVSIASPGSLTFANSAASAGGFAVTAGGNLTFANVGASGALGVSAGGLATFNGVATGSSIAVTSGDIRVGATARLGQRGVTGTIALTNSAPGAGTAIGGAAAASGWSLDSAEALRLFADQGISISVPAAASNPAPVTIGNLAVTFGAGGAAQGPGANIGSGGTLSVSTPGVIRVTGAVAPVISGNADLVALNAGQRIDVVTDTGSVVLRNANGALAGTLRMSAPTVRVATSQAMAALDQGLSLPAASARLDSNDGLVNTAGAVQADALVFNVAASTLYIQNSGVDSQFANRRGFTANSVAINGLSGAAPSFAVNGVVLDANGQPITGLNTYRAIQINGVPAALGGAFNALSTVNGCAVGLDCSVPTGTIAPPRDVIADLTKVITAGSGRDATLNLPIVQFGETPLLDSPPLIDEPVTGVGNDDLWEKRCPLDKECKD